MVRRVELRSAKVCFVQDRQLSYVQAILGALISGEVRYVVLRQLG